MRNCDHVTLAIEKHLGSFADTDEISADTKRFVHTLGFSPENFAMAGPTDAEALEDLYRNIFGALTCVRKLSTAIHIRLGFEFATEVETKLSANRGDLLPSAKGMMELFPVLGLMKILRELESTVGPAAKTVARGLSDYIPKGKRNWKAVLVTHICREVWTRRTGRRAPADARSGRHSKFLDFLGDMLEALEVDAKPVPALRSWRSAHSTPEFFNMLGVLNDVSRS